MEMTDGECEFLLFDRMEAIKSAMAKFGQENFYLSFSGGKDSTVLHRLLDMAVPGNEIPRVFIDTGIEYRMVSEFAKEMADGDGRFVTIKPSKPIRAVLETYGYPFKSKEHSLRVYEFNKGSEGRYIEKYITGKDKDGKPTKFKCPNALLYQFEEKGDGEDGDE